MIENIQIDASKPISLSKHFELIPYPSIPIHFLFKNR